MSRRAVVASSIAGLVVAFAVALVVLHPWSRGGVAAPVSTSDAPSSRSADAPSRDASSAPGGDASDEQGRTAESSTSSPENRPIGSVRGRLVDAAQDSPLAGLAVRCDSSDARATTAADGSFDLAGVPAGGTRLWIEHAFLRISGDWIHVKETGVTDVGDLAVKSGGSIRGRVLDPDGAPVANALVRAGERPPFGGASFEGPRDRGPGVARTGADGAFVLPAVVANRARTIVATHPDFAPSSLERVVARAGEETVVPDLRLGPGTSISGRVTDPTGKPIEGATVRVRSEDAARFDVGPFEREAKTGDDGRFVALHLVPGKKTIVAAAKGFARATREGVVVSGLTSEEAATVDFVLEPGRSISGRVSSPEGAPLAKVRVNARPVDAGEMPGRGASTESASDGSFRLEGLGAGAFVLNVWAAGYVPAIRAGVAAESSDVEIVLSRGAAISGRVTAADTGDGIAGARVTVGSRTGEGPMQSTTSDASGAFRVEGLPEGSYVATATGGSYAEARTDAIAVRAGEESRDVSLALPPGGEIQGFVLDAADRSPVAGAVVRVVGKGDGSEIFGLPMAVGSQEDDVPVDLDGARAARTAKDGSFTLSGLAGGATTVEALDRRHVSGRAPEVFVDRGGLVRNVEILLSRGGAVRGVVLGDDGQPEAGAHVSITGEHDVAKEGESDAEGNYLVEGIPAGRYQVFRYSAGIDSGVQESISAEVREGETTIVDFGKRGGHCRLWGAVRDGDETVPFATIDFWLESDSDQYQGRSVTADAHGAYEVPGILPGRYRAAINQRYQGTRASFAALVDVPATASDLRVDLVAPQGGIAGRVLDATTGEPIAGAFVSVAGGEESNGEGGQAVTSSDGRYEIAHLVAGTYEATVDPPSSGDRSPVWAQEQAKGIVVGEGRVTTLDFKLIGGGSLEVGVRNAAGDRLVQVYGRLVDDSGRDLGLQSWDASAPGAELRGDSIHPGVFVLEVVANGYAATRRTGVRVEAGRTRHEDVVLTPGGSLRVRVVDPDGRDVEAPSVSLRTADGLEPLVDDGLFGAGAEEPSPPGWFAHLAPGSYVVTAVDDAGREASATVSVEEGRETSAVIELR